MVPYDSEVVEQDSLEDVANCVITILATPVGSRDLAPDFGVVDMTFSNQPIGAQERSSILLIGGQEPRAIIEGTERFDINDPLIDVINLKISSQTKKQER